MFLVCSLNEKIEPLEKEAETVKAMYDLIEEYKVPCPPEDLVVYATLFNTITLCRNAIDKALTERDSNIAKFCNVLDKDIGVLTEECRRIKQQAQVKNNIILYITYYRYLSII